jgi:hypothetical protein
VHALRLLDADSRRVALGRSLDQALEQPAKPALRGVRDHGPVLAERRDPQPWRERTRDDRTKARVDLLFNGEQRSGQRLVLHVERRRELRKRVPAEKTSEVPQRLVDGRTRAHSGALEEGDELAVRIRAIELVLRGDFVRQPAGAQVVGQAAEDDPVNSAPPGSGTSVVS